MQDTDTGDMIEINEDMAKIANQHGLCVLAEGEIVDIKGGNFKVESIGKHKLTFKCPENIFDLKIKTGERFPIKNGTFVVENYGSMYLQARGLPGNKILNQEIVDEFRKQEIQQLRK